MSQKLQSAKLLRKQTVNGSEKSIAACRVETLQKHFSN